MTTLIGGSVTAVELEVPRSPSAARLVSAGRAKFLPVLVLSAGLVGAAAAVGLLSTRVLPFLALVLGVNHWIGTRAGTLSFPTPGRLVHGLTLPPTLAALSAAGGVLSQDDVQDVLALSVIGALLTSAVYWVRRAARRRVRVALVGSPADVMDLAARWAGNRHLHVVGGLAVGSEPLVPRQRGPEGDSAVSEQEEHVLHGILDMRPDVVVVIPGDPWDPEIVRRLGWQLEGTDIELVVSSRLEGIATHRLEHERVAGVDVVKVRPSRPSRVVRAIKGSIDRVLGAVLLVLLAPCILALVLAIRLTSPGPGFFVQLRVGQHGRPFKIFKLRTMTTSAEAEKDALRGQDDGNGILFKKRDDPRVTRLGRVIRKYSLDELPQLVNVVRGEMSLIGPRPALPEEVAQYTDLERRRLAVRPGMTGAWQVGGRSTLGREESVRLDVNYVDNYRLADDAVIALKTVDAVIRPKGAW